MKPKPPVFHIPVGWQRDEGGEIVLFNDEEDQRGSIEG